ncbi:MAG: RtcB family protein [Bacteroidales bacterium]|nr:RtcB family protein [Bacteroidales bacterium]
MYTFKNSIGNTIKIFADNIEATALEQIKDLAECEAYRQEKIRIMPDVHAGKGCVIGTTMTVTNKLTPNLVGVDIGCGVTVAKIRLDGPGRSKSGRSKLDLHKLDNAIKKYIPSGFSVKDKPLPFDFSKLRCARYVDLKRAYHSIGTLGGGNHFIEVGKDTEGALYLLIHSGSRNLGVGVCSYYQKRAQKQIKDTGKDYVHRDLAWLEDSLFEDYLNDMEITQRYASHNRDVMLQTLTEKMNLTCEKIVETIHNYIDTKNMILRKGAVSAQKGELLVIPLNMRDGTLLCRGKGNPDWNYSAPHGAGRILSRTKARELLVMKDFVQSMDNIYSTSVSKKTLDEAPQAYKPKEEILQAIEPTAEVLTVIRPIYNFKAG